jgi:hypothetical protein
MWNIREPDCVKIFVYVVNVEQCALPCWLACFDATEEGMVESFDTRDESAVEAGLATTENHGTKEGAL